MNSLNFFFATYVPTAREVGRGRRKAGGGGSPTYPWWARRLWNQAAAPSINAGTQSHRITVALYIGTMGTCAFLVNMLKRNQTNATKLKQSMLGNGEPQTDLHTVFYLMGVSVLQIYKGNHLGKEVSVFEWLWVKTTLCCRKQANVKVLFLQDTFQIM